MRNPPRPPTTLWHALLSTLRSQHGANASRTALISPSQQQQRQGRSGSIKHNTWSYAELQRHAQGLSLGLQDRGVKQGSVVATDLPNVAEGVILHLACARLGAAIATAKNADQLQSMMHSPSLLATSSIQCAVLAPSTEENASWLSQQEFAAPHIIAGDEEMESMLHIISTATAAEPSSHGSDAQLDDDTDEFAVGRPLGYFGTASNALTHGEALQQGRDMVDYFGMNERDRVCVSVTLYHAFGIGSAASSALQSGAAIVLPAVSGLQGCGVPSQRAAVTLQTLVSEQCSLLFADTHTLRELHDESLAQDLAEANLSAHLRGGVCKTGSGTEILSETIDLADVRLATLGKRS